MNVQTRAKFRVNSVQPQIGSNNQPYAELWKLNPVHSDDPQSENHQFWKATPTGELTMTVTNPAIFGTLQEGQEYYLDITSAE